VRLILTRSIVLREYCGYENIFPLEVIKKAARKALGGLGNLIRNPFKYPFTILRKIPLTAPGGAGRAIFLIQTRDNDAVLVLLRLKNDKLIGNNISLHNKRLIILLKSNLDMILEDLGNGSYEEFGL